MVWQHCDRRQTYRFALVLALGLAVGAGATVITESADATTDLSVGNLTASDVNRTITGNVTGGTFTADLAYETTAPSSNQILLKFKAGPDTGNLSTLEWRQYEVSGATSGDATLSGSFADAGIDPLTLDPSVGATRNSTVYVAATIEVSRSGGTTMNKTVIEPVTLRLHDDGSLTASVGGQVDVSVTTSG